MVIWSFGKKRQWSVEYAAIELRPNTNMRLQSGDFVEIASKQVVLEELVVSIAWIGFVNDYTRVFETRSHSTTRTWMLAATGYLVNTPSVDNVKPGSPSDQIAVLYHFDQFARS